MRARARLAALAAVTSCIVLVFGAVRPSAADVNMYDGKWHFIVAPYVWLPTINATLALPGVPGAGGGGGGGGGGAAAGTATVQIGPNQLLEHLNFAFLGYIEARKGDWSVFTDIIYMNASGQGASIVNVGNGPINTNLNIGTSANTQFTLGTLAGSRTLVHTDTATLDGFLGTRYLGTDLTVNWNLTGPIGAFPQSGTVSRSKSWWDGVAGVKGRVQFKPDSRWFVPYYFDFGAGAFTTWQGFAGVGYAFSWGDVVLSYRHMYIDVQGDLLQNTTLSGPMLGVAFRW